MIIKEENIQGIGPQKLFGKSKAERCATAPELRALNLINNIWSLNSKRFSQFYDNLKVYFLIKIQDNLITESGFISI